MFLYMAVTDDKYELPIAVEDSISKLASRLGLRYNTILVSFSRQSKSSRSRKLNCKFVKVEVD